MALFITAFTGTSLYLVLDVSTPYSNMSFLEYPTLLKAINKTVVPLLRSIPSALNDVVRYVKYPSVGEPHCQHEVSNTSVSHRECSRTACEQALHLAVCIDSVFVQFPSYSNKIRDYTLTQYQYIANS